MRDTGATIDLVSNKYVNVESFTGESAWIRQPLDTQPTCLPVAVVRLQGEFGEIMTKAAVTRECAGLPHYLLSNSTAMLLAEVLADRGAGN